MNIFDIAHLNNELSRVLGVGENNFPSEFFIMRKWVSSEINYWLNGRDMQRLSESSSQIKKAFYTNKSLLK